MIQKNIEITFTLLSLKALISEYCYFESGLEIELELKSLVDGSGFAMPYVVSGPLATSIPKGV